MTLAVSDSKSKRPWTSWDIANWPVVCHVRALLTVAFVVVSVVAGLVLLCGLFRAFESPRKPFGTFLWAYLRDMVPQAARLGLTVLWSPTKR